MSMPSLLELHGTHDISVPRLPLIELPRSSKTFTLEKIDQRGRFFFHKEQKFFLQGVTYGPFAPSAGGVPFPELAKVDLDFALMAELGVNCFRTFTVPPKSLLDKAAANGLRVIVGIPWPQHISFLDSKRTRSKMPTFAAHGVAACSSHPAVFAYLVGNEIPPEIVRWYGAGKIRAVLSTLVGTAKNGGPSTLASYD